MGAKGSQVPFVLWLSERATQECPPSRSEGLYFSAEPFAVPILVLLHWVKET